MIDLHKINKEITNEKYKGYTPTHIRIHPDVFKQLINHIWDCNIEIDTAKKITLLGLTVWFDEKMSKDSVCIYDMNYIMKEAMVFHDFINEFG